jgi:hypothetical protein
VVQALVAEALAGWWQAGRRQVVQALVACGLGAGGLALWIGRGRPGRWWSRRLALA